MNRSIYKDIAIDEMKSLALKARDYFSNPPLFDKNYGIDQSTFRAYRGFKFKPSEIYRNWAQEMANNTAFINQVIHITSYDDFKTIHSGARDNLANVWKSKQGRELAVPYLNKLIDLYFKFLTTCNMQSDSKFNANIVCFGHIPLDKYSLLAIKYLFYGIVLSKNPSMGDITDMQTYYFLQDQIRSLMNAANLPNLYFDYYAWNSKH